LDKKCLVIRAGLVDYGRALRLQENIFKLKKEGKLDDDVVIFLQHPPTITIGKKGSLNELLAGKKELEKKGIVLYEIGRGGRITYHGPGQLVGYPILDLANYGRDLHLYLRLLEEVIIRTLEDFGIVAERKKGLTGVWVKDKKIASIGVQAKSWISMHGFAFNINCDLSYFNLIQPCGLQPQVITSLATILQKDIKVEEVEENVLSHFTEVFSVKTKQISFGQLLGKINYQIAYS